MRLDYDYDSSDRSDLRWFHGAPGWNFVTFKRTCFVCLFTPFLRDTNLSKLADLHD